MNWINYDDSDIRDLLGLPTEDTVTLEHVEEFAKYSRLIASEEELSAQFDESILPLVLEAYGEDDGPALRESFNDWTDSLCKDGDLHSLQYDAYCYVGRHIRRNAGR